MILITAEGRDGDWRGRGWVKCNTPGHWERAHYHRCTQSLLDKKKKYEKEKGVTFQFPLAALSHHWEFWKKESQMPGSLSDRHPQPCSSRSSRLSVRGHSIPTYSVMWLAGRDWNQYDWFPDWPNFWINRYKGYRNIVQTVSKLTDWRQNEKVDDLSPIHFGCNSVACKLHPAPLGSSLPSRRVVY